MHASGDGWRFDAGAMNCHVPEIRLGPDVGIAPCFGLGRSTTEIVRMFPSLVA